MRKYISFIVLISAVFACCISAKGFEASDSETEYSIYFTQSGEEVSFLSGGKVISNAEISGSEELCELSLISALYDNETLIEIKTEDIISYDGVYSTEAIDIPYDNIDNKYMKAFLWTKNLNPICTESIEKELEIKSFSLNLNSSQYHAYINNSRGEIDAFIPSMVNSGNSSDIDYGIGSLGYDTAIKNVTSEIIANIPASDNSIRDFSNPQLYKLIGSVSEKTYIARAHKTILQYSTGFEGERILGSRETDASNYDVRRLQLPSMAGEGKAEWVWAASGETADTNHTQFVTDNISGSRVFEVKKTDSDANADFYTHIGRVQSNVDCVVTEYDICINELSDNGEIYIGGDGGNGVYNGRMALKLTKGAGGNIALSVVKGVNSDNNLITLTDFERKIHENTWYRIKTVHKLKFNNDTGYTSVYDICIDGEYIGSAVCNEYSLEYRLNNVMTGFYSSDNTTFSMRLDNYSMQYCIGDEMNYLNTDTLLSLEKLDTLLDDKVLDFLYETYDPDSGAFYYAISSRDTDRFRPSVEASFFALNILRYGGALPQNNGSLTSTVYPESMRGRLINFVKSMQSEYDGYFYDEQWGMDVSDSKKTRDANEASEILAWFGETPQYPYPWDRNTLYGIRAMSLNEGGVSNNLDSAEQFTEYLNRMNWDEDIWSVGNELSSAKTLIESAGYADELRTYLEIRIDPETGLWGKGQDITKRINGSMKLANFYLDKPYPYARNMIKTVIDALIYLDTEEFCNNCSAPELWNPFELISRAMSSSELGYTDRKYIYDNIDSIIDKILIIGERFRKPDGGYSYNADCSSSSIQACEASLGLYESDMDATVMFAINIRRSIYSIIGLEMPKPLSGEKGKVFIQKLLEKGQDL